MFTVVLSGTPETHLENLHRLVDWVEVTVCPHNHLCDRLHSVIVRKPPTFETANLLWELASRSNPSVARPADIREGKACRVLFVIYNSACWYLRNILALASVEVTRWEFEVHGFPAGSITLSPKGKRASHNNSEFPKEAESAAFAAERWLSVHGLDPEQWTPCHELPANFEEWVATYGFRPKWPKDRMG